MDALGSTIGMTDGTGSLATTYWYDPFGATTVGGAPNGNSSQFASRESDGGGLYYNRARYYSTTTGRFLSEDPLGFAGSGMNLYAYAVNNPISLRDPFGLSSRPNSPFANPALWALMIGTEDAGGGPEDPLADAAVGEEIAAAEGAAAEGGAPGLGDIARQAAQGFQNGQCQACAQAVIDAVEAAGGEANPILIDTGDALGNGNIYSDVAGDNISTNGIHQAVEVDGMVYDNITPNGMAFSDWINSLNVIFGSIDDYLYF